MGGKVAKSSKSICRLFEATAKEFEAAKVKKYDRDLADGRRRARGIPVFVRFQGNAPMVVTTDQLTRTVSRSNRPHTWLRMRNDMSGWTHKYATYCERPQKHEHVTNYRATIATRSTQCPYTQSCSRTTTTTLTDRTLALSTLKRISSPPLPVL